MKGTSHYAIGIAAGVAFGIYGIRQGNFSFAAGILSAPVAAMLPDIDHNDSKAGRLRKHAARVITAAFGLFFIGAVVYYKLFDTIIFADIFANIFTSLLIPGLGLFLLVAALIYFGKKVRFLSMHRGIMHTLLLPICAIVIALFVEENFIRILLHGFAIGYISHIFADCLTKQGCPILFPLTSKSICILGRRGIITGEKRENTVKNIVIVALIIAALLLPVGFSFDLLIAFIRGL